MVDVPPLPGTDTARRRFAPSRWVLRCRGRGRHAISSSRPSTHAEPVDSAIGASSRPSTHVEPVDSAIGGHISAHCLSQFCHRADCRQSARSEARLAALLIGLSGAEDARDTFFLSIEHGRASLRLGLQCSTPAEWMCLGVEHWTSTTDHPRRHVEATSVDVESRRVCYYRRIECGRRPCRSDESRRRASRVVVVERATLDTSSTDVDHVEEASSTTSNDKSMCRPIGECAYPI